jgi:hypothetical protein
MNQACFFKHTTRHKHSPERSQPELHGTNQHACSIRPLGNNIVRMKNAMIFLGIIASIGIISCKDKGPEIKFTGITGMDKFGAVVGKADTTDWRTDDQWLDKEQKLFSENFSANCADPGKYRIMFYPNPCRSKSTLYAVKDSGVRVAIRLVDKNFNVIMSQDSVYVSSLSVDLSSFTLNDTIRLYYKFITPDNCEYWGHGDIFVQPYEQKKY